MMQQLRAQLQRQRQRVFGPVRWPLATQARFCQLLADQLGSGFSLKQAVTFLRTVAGDFPGSLQTIEAGLLEGSDLIGLLEPHLQANVYFQLRLTTTHGELAPALAEAAKLLRLMATQRQKVRQLLAYPLGLFVSMAVLFGTLQMVILPQLQTEVTAKAPATLGWQQYGWLGIGSAVVLGLVWAGRWWLQQPSLRLANMYVHLPVIGRVCRAYYAYYLTANLGQLIGSGLSVKQMVAVLRQLPERALLHQLARVLDQQLAGGQLPVGWLRGQPFIPAQLLVFLQKGSPTVQLARELQAFSDLQYRDLVRRTERGVALIQPILLGIVALLIVGAYLSLLLPMYQNLQGVYHD